MKNNAYTWEILSKNIPSFHWLLLLITFYYNKVNFMHLEVRQYEFLDLHVAHRSLFDRYTCIYPFSSRGGSYLISCPNTFMNWCQLVDTRGIRYGNVFTVLSSFYSSLNSSFLWHCITARTQAMSLGYINHV